MKVVAIVQARMGSTRLPGKVLLPLAGVPMLLRIVERLRLCQAIEDVVVATSDTSSDEPIRELCIKEDIAYFAGSEHDVLSRFYFAAKQYTADVVVRITGDCPLVDPATVDAVVALFQSGHYDHVGVATGAGAIGAGEKRFPDGLDAECFSFLALERAWRESSNPQDREHVTPYIWRNKDMFSSTLLLSPRDLSGERWTVDTKEDYEFVSVLYEALGPKPFGLEDVLAYLATHPELSTKNKVHIGNEGYEQLWQGKDPHNNQ